MTTGATPCSQLQKSRSLLATGIDFDLKSIREFAIVLDKVVWMVGVDKVGRVVGMVGVVCSLYLCLKLIVCP